MVPSEHPALTRVIGLMLIRKSSWKNNSWLKALRNCKRENNEYVIDRIIRHVIQYDMKKYEGLWYGHAPEENTSEPPPHPPNNFNVRYWKQKKSLHRQGKHKNASPTNTTNPLCLVKTRVTDVEDSQRSTYREERCTELRTIAVQNQRLIGVRTVSKTQTSWLITDKDLLKVRRDEVALQWYTRTKPASKSST